MHAHELFVDGCFNGDPHPGLPPSPFQSLFLFPAAPAPFVSSLLSTVIAFAPRPISLSSLFLSGNILLLPDGRLGLIDYGQVKRLSLNERISYAKLICALAREDRAAIVSRIREMS